MDIAYKYIGSGAYVVGLPRRDITTAEVDRYTELLATPGAQSLYAPVHKGKAKAKAEDHGSATTGAHDTATEAAPSANSAAQE